MDKHVPNESEAIRASGSITQLRQMTQPDSDKNFTNKYLSFNRKAAKSPFETEMRQQTEHDNPPFATCDPAMQMKYESNRSENQRNESQQSFQLSSANFNTNPVENKGGRRGTFKTEKLISHSNLMSEDILDDHEEARQTPNLLKSGTALLETNLDMDYMSQIKLKKQKKSDQNNYSDVIKNRQKDMEEKIYVLQQQVDQKTSELNDFRKKNKFIGVSKDVFKPFKRTETGGLKEEDVEQIMKLANRDGKRMTLQNLDQLPPRQRMSLETITQQIKKISSDLKDTPMQKNNDNDFMRETSAQVLDEFSPIDSDKFGSSQPRKHKINVSEFIQGGGLNQYNQGSQYTSRSTMGQRMTITNETPAASSTFRDNTPSNRMQKLYTSNVNRLEESPTQKTLDKTLKRDSVSMSQNFAGLHMSESLKLRLEGNQNQESYIRNQILSGAITNVVIHPQQVKQLGLKPQVPDPAKNQLRLKACSSVKSLRSIQSPELQSPLRTQKSSINIGFGRKIPDMTGPPRSKEVIKTVTSRKMISQSIYQKNGGKKEQNDLTKSIKITSTNDSGLPRPLMKKCQSPRVQKSSMKSKLLVNEDSDEGTDFTILQRRGKEKRGKVRNLSLSHVAGENKTSLSYSVQKSASKPQANNVRTIELYKENPRTPQDEIKEENEEEQRPPSIDPEQLKILNERYRNKVMEQENIMAAMLKEEKYLFQFARETKDMFQSIQMSENQGDEMEVVIQDYKVWLQQTGIDKIRVMFFVRQLQISFILTKAFLRVFSSTIVQKFQVKLEHIFQNVHQNFLLIIDMILKEQLQQMEANHSFWLPKPSVTLNKSINYQQLRAIINTKLRLKEKQGKALTKFRQNNEVNIQNLKKIAKYVVDSYSPECANYKHLAEEIQDVIKNHLSNVIVNLNSQSFDLQTNLPTSQIDFINKSIEQRINQVFQANSVTQSLEFSTKKRQKSNMKIFSPEKQSNKISGILNNSFVFQQSNINLVMKQQSPLQPEKPARINDLGKSPGVLAARKTVKRSPGKAGEQINSKKQELRDVRSPDLAQSFIQSENNEAKRCGSSNMVLNARPGSPGLVKGAKTPYQRKKFTGAPKSPEQKRMTSNSALGQYSSSNRLTVAQANTRIDKRKTEPVNSSVMKPKESSPLKSQIQRKLTAGAGASVKQSSLNSERKHNFNTEKKKQAKAQASPSKQKGPQQINSRETKSKAGVQQTAGRSFFTPETMAFIESQIQSQNVVNNNINIYGPIVNHVYQQPYEMFSPGIFEEEQKEMEHEETERQQMEEEKKEFDLLDHMRNNRNIMSTAKKSLVAKRLFEPSPNENIQSHQSSAQKEIREFTQGPFSNQRKSERITESQLKPPSRQRVSPRLVEQLEQIPFSPVKSVRAKSGIGSGIKNLKNAQEQWKNNREVQNDYINPIMMKKIQPEEYNSENEAPPEPESISKVKKINHMSSVELDEFQLIEEEIKQSQIRDEFSTPNSPDLKAYLGPDKEENMSPIHHFPQRMEVTEPRRYKRGNTENELIESKSYTNPRSKRTNKRYFMGEYDATAEEEQSLINSQKSKNIRNNKTIGTSAEISPFLNDKSVQEAQNRASVPFLENSQKVNEGYYAKQHNTTAQEMEITERRSESEVNPSQSENKDEYPEMLSEVDDDIQEQTLTIKPHHFEQKPEEIVDTFALANDITHDVSEQEQIDQEYRQLKEKVTFPFLPPLRDIYKLPKHADDISDVYTLVLDLDETLIHYEPDDDEENEDGGYYNIRPGAIRFLSTLSEYFEVIVFTAAMPDYADWILDDIDRLGKVSHRLYRQHTTPHEDYAIKDLNNLGRDLSRTIIIDNLAENFNYTTPLNGIWVESWYDDMDDNILGLLIPFLKQIVELKVDVRQVLTEQNKENILYGLLQDQKDLPSVSMLIEGTHNESYFEEEEIRSMD